MAAERFRTGRKEGGSSVPDCLTSGVEGKGLHRHRRVAPSGPRPGTCVLLPPLELIERPRSLLLPSLARNPKLVAVLHDVGQDGPAEEDHVLAPRRVLDPDLEVLRGVVSRAGGLRDLSARREGKPKEEPVVQVDDERANGP